MGGLSFMTPCQTRLLSKPCSKAARIQTRPVGHQNLRYSLLQPLRLNCCSLTVPISRRPEITATPPYTVRCDEVIHQFFPCCLKKEPVSTPRTRLVPLPYTS